jgi:hypothetical protein
LNKDETYKKDIYLFTYLFIQNKDEGFSSLDLMENKK